MSAVDKIGTLAEVVINEQQFSDQRGAMFKLSDAIESQIASTTSTDFTHLSTSTTSFTNDISSLQNLRNSNFITKKSKCFIIQKYIVYNCSHFYNIFSSHHRGLGCYGG